jgi:hypothetical protein
MTRQARPATEHNTTGLTPAAPSLVTRRPVAALPATTTVDANQGHRPEEVFPQDPTVY